MNMQLEKIFVCSFRPSVGAGRPTVYQRCHQKRLPKHTLLWIPPSERIGPQQHGTWIWDSREATAHIHISAATRAANDYTHTHVHILRAHRDYPQQILPDIHTCCSCVSVLWWCLCFIQPESPPPSFSLDEGIKQNAALGVETLSGTA